MVLTFYGYVRSHIGTGFGIFIITRVVLALLSKYSYGIYAFLINRLLGVEIIYPSDKNNSTDATIKIDGRPLKANYRYFARYIQLIGTITLTVALSVLYEGCILGSAGVYLGDQCPSDPMTCFVFAVNDSSVIMGTFQYVPGNTKTFPEGKNNAWCYGWIVTRQSV